MKQSLIYAGTWFIKQHRISHLLFSLKPPLIIAAMALLLLCGVSALHVTAAGFIEGLLGEPKPMAIILLGIGGNGLVGVALSRKRNETSPE